MYLRSRGDPESARAAAAPRLRRERQVGDDRRLDVVVLQLVAAARCELGAGLAQLGAGRVGRDPRRDRQELPLYARIADVVAPVPAREPALGDRGLAVER